MKQAWVVVAGVLASSCGLLDDSDDGGSLPPIIEGTWDVDRPVVEVAPGERVDLHVTGVDVEATSLVLWLDDAGGTGVPILGVHDGPVANDGDVSITITTPFLTTGEHSLWLGTADGTRTGAIPLTVVVPPPRLTKAEAARTFANGIDNLVTSVEALVDDPDPEWQQALAELPTRDKLETALATLHRFRDEIEAGYLAIPDAEEPGVQSLLDHGLLAGFEGGIDARPASANDLRDLLPHVIARLLYQLDLASITIGTLGDVIGVAAIFTSVGPGTQPASIPLHIAELVVHALRFAIDNFIPTDLVKLETMGQPEIHDLQIAHKWHYWGTFTTEIQDGSGTLGSLDNFIAAVIGGAIGDRGGMLVQRGKDAALAILTKLGLIGIDALFSQGPAEPRTKWLALVNMGAYSLTLSDVLELVPFAVPIGYAFEAWWDPELSPAVTVADATPTWALTTEINLDYAEDLISVSHVEWPVDPNGPTSVLRIAGEAKSWKQRTGYWVFNYPGWDTITGEASPRFDKLLPFGPNYTREDGYLHILGMPLGPEGFVIEASPTEGTFAIGLQDLAGGRFDNQQLSIKVNGSVQVANQVLASGETAGQVLTLRRGLNTIEVTALEVHAVPYDAGGHQRGFAMKMTFSDAIAQLDKTRDIFLNKNETWTLHVMLPPAF